MTSRKKPGVAFWAIVGAVVLLLAYPLSFGPACWIASRQQPSGEDVSAAYRPILWFWASYPKSWLSSALADYVSVGARCEMFEVRQNPAEIVFR
jgi:hypothetical protein